MAQTSWLSNAGKKVQTDAFVAAVKKYSVHIGAPGTTGANELAGTTKGSINLQTDAAGAISLAGSGNTDMTIPATATAVQFVGLWSTDGATFYGYVDIPDEPYPNGGTFHIASAVGTLMDSVA